MTGAATAAGTRRYAVRLSDLPAAHFRTLDDLTVSSIGLGTYLGEEDDATDAAYAAAARHVIAAGVNVLDTAINYRFQRSERALGTALADLVGAETVARDEVVVCTKAGYLPFDGWEPVDPEAYVRDVYLGPGVFTPEDVVAGCHVMTPRYVADQLARSRRNLGLDHLDVAYLHNPETQLAEVPRREFDARVRAAFSTFEEEVAAGRIGRYGVATWHGLRRSADARDHLSLADLVAAARDVAGDGHHFRVIQLPFNLVMPEAFATPTQEVDGHRLTALAAAEALGIAVMVSAPLLQGQLSLRLPSRMGEAFPGLDTPAQWALQFARSAPGVTTALVGMSGPAHVRDNVAVARVPPAPAGVDSLFTHG